MAICAWYARNRLLGIGCTCTVLSLPYKRLSFERWAPSNCLVSTHSSQYSIFHFISHTTCLKPLQIHCPHPVVNLQQSSTHIISLISHGEYNTTPSAYLRAFVWELDREPAFEMSGYLRTEDHQTLYFNDYEIDPLMETDANTEASLALPTTGVFLTYVD